MTLEQVWLDLHESNYEGNIMTEYEEKIFKQRTANLPSGSPF